MSVDLDHGSGGTDRQLASPFPVEATRNGNVHGISVVRLFGFLDQRRGKAWVRRRLNGANSVVQLIGRQSCLLEEIVTKERPTGGAGASCARLTDTVTGQPLRLNGAWHRHRHTDSSFDGKWLAKFHGFHLQLVAHQQHQLVVARREPGQRDAIQSSQRSVRRRGQCS